MSNTVHEVDGIFNKHKEDILLAIRSGDSINAVSKKYGISRQSISARLSSLSVSSSHVRRKGIDSSEHERIVVMYNSGIPVTTIANDYGFCRKAVLTVVKNSGVTLGYSKTESKQNTLLRDNATLIRKLFSKGKSIKHVSQRFQVSQTTIARFCKQEGIVHAKRPCQKVFVSDLPKICQMISEGKSAKEVAATLGVGVHSLCNFTRRHDVFFRRKPDSPAAGLANLESPF